MMVWRNADAGSIHSSIFAGHLWDEFMLEAVAMNDETLRLMNNE
jgi:hypothetical protein